MSTHFFNDISKIYQEQIMESTVPGKPAERVGALTNIDIPQSEQDAARKRTLEKAKLVRKRREEMKSEERDPFGRPGGKHGGVGKKGGGYDRAWQAIKNENERIERGEKPATKKRYKEMREALDPVGQEDADVNNNQIDNDKSDNYILRKRRAISKAISQRNVKEGFSNWRQDLSEVIDTINNKEKNDKIVEKNVNNKIKINPNIGEAVEELGGTLLEIVEIDEIDFVVESVYDELLSEGYEDDDIEDALEYALTEATVTYGHDTDQPYQKKTGAGRLARAVGRLARQKLASKVRGAKKSASAAVARGARKVAKGALGVARKMEGGDSKPSAAHTKTRTASTYRGAGSGTKEKVSSGSYTPPTKKKAEKPSDPWEGSATAPEKPKTKKAPVAKTKKVSAPKKKRKSKLDSLLADIRSEETQVSEALRSREERMARMMTDKDRQKQKKKRELKAKADEIISTERALSKGRKNNTEKTYNTPPAEVRKLKFGQKKDTLAMKAREAMEEYEIDEKLNLKTADMGDVIKDFQKSDAPQFKGKTEEERRQMAIAAKLTAERGGKKLGEQQEGGDQEQERQQMLANKKKMLQMQMMLQRKQLQMQKQGKLPLNYGEETALDRVRASIIAKHGKGMIHDPNAPKKPRTQKKSSNLKPMDMTKATDPGPGSRYRGD